MLPQSTPPLYNVRRPPKMGNRTDNLTIRLDQKPYFALISFRSPLGARNGCTWRMSVLRIVSYDSFENTETVERQLK